MAKNPSITDNYLYLIMMFLLYLVGLVGVASAANQAGTETGDFPSLLRGNSVPSGRSAMLEAASFRTRSQVAADNKMAGPRLMATLSPPSEYTTPGFAIGFGQAVAVSGQGKVLVGAPWSDNSKGKVFLYDIGSEELEELVVNNDQISTKFGQAVAFSYGSAVIGAPNDFNYHGAVYLNMNVKTKGSLQIQTFIKSNDGSLQLEEKIEKIIAEDGAFGEWFGFSLAASDGNIAIGAIYDDDKGADSGSVYLYPSGIKVTAEDGAAGDEFGYSVALWDATLVVGAPYNDDKGSRSGAAYIFKPDSTGEYIRTKKLTADDGQANDRFGTAVAITETKIFVGAPYHGSSYSGAVYQYRRSRSYDYQGNYTGQAGYDFGYSLAATDEVLAIGAPGRNSVTVYIHKADSDAITINPDTTDGVSGFGYAVSISGDTLVVGTYTGDKAYVYDISAIAFLDHKEA